jgi:hypothetical protein
MLKKVHDRFGHLLAFDSERIQPDLERLSIAVKEKGAPLDCCIGFIDGTARGICRANADRRRFLVATNACIG